MDIAIKCIIILAAAIIIIFVPLILGILLGIIKRSEDEFTACCYCEYYDIESDCCTKGYTAQLKGCHDGKKL